MKKRDFTKGSILGNILTFSLPYMLSYFLQILYGLADLFVTGRYCNVASITTKPGSRKNGKSTSHYALCDGHLRGIWLYMCYHSPICSRYGGKIFYG